MHPKRSNKNCTEAILCVQGDGDGEREKKREKRSSEREEKRSARIDEKLVSQPSPGEEQKARQHLPFEFSFAVDYCSCVGQLLFQGGKLFRSQAAAAGKTSTIDFRHSSMLLHFSSF
jgi:hypothetical protein